MRLVYVVRTFPKVSETFVVREVRELLERGVDVTVWSLTLRRGGARHRRRPRRHAVRARPVARAFAAALLRTGPRVVPALGWALGWALRERDWRQLAALPYAAWLARQLPPGAHVHAHFANAPATVALLAARLGGTRFSFTGHAKDMFVATSRRFLAEKVRAAHAVVVGTEFARAYVRETAPGAGVTLVRNGLDAAELAGAPEQPRADKTVVAVGRLVEKKGLDTLVAAAALLPGVAVRIVGDGPLRADLERQIETLEVADRVHLLGARDAAGVRAELAAATVFALPCRVDAQGDVDSGPLAILEAMAARTPVISTPVGGIAEVVVDGASGLLVPPGDAPALAAAIDRLLSDANLRASLARGGREVVERDSLAAGVDRLLGVYGLR